MTFPKVISPDSRFELDDFATAMQDRDIVERHCAASSGVIANRGMMIPQRGQRDGKGGEGAGTAPWVVAALQCFKIVFFFFYNTEIA